MGTGIFGILAIEPWLAILRVGIGLTLGFLTPFAALGGLVMNLNYITVSGVKPNDISVNECFRVDQGQNYIMILSELIILFTGAWSVWSLNALLQMPWTQSPRTGDPTWSPPTPSPYVVAPTPSPHVVAPQTNNAVTNPP